MYFCTFRFVLNLYFIVILSNYKFGPLDSQNIMRKI